MSEPDVDVRFGVEGIREIHPAPGFILVKKEDERKGPSGIVLPQGTRGRPNEGLVIEVGSTQRGGFGTAAAEILEPGMTVWWLPDRGLDVGDYVVVLAESVVAYERPTA